MAVFTEGLMAENKTQIEGAGYYLSGDGGVFLQALIEQLIAPPKQL